MFLARTGIRSTDENGEGKQKAMNPKNMPQLAKKRAPGAALVYNVPAGRSTGEPARAGGKSLQTPGDARLVKIVG